MNTRDAAKQIRKQATDKMSSVSKVNESVASLAALASQLKQIADSLNANGSAEVAKSITQATLKLTELPSKMSEGMNKADRTDEVLNALKGVVQALESKDFSPNISVKSPNVVQQNLDVSSIERAVSSLKQSIEASKPEEVKFDEVIQGLSSVKNAITSLRFPVANYILPFKDSGGKAIQVQLDGSGNLPISASFTPSTSTSNTATSVATSITSATLLASNVSRKGATIYNDATTVLYVKLGTTASATSFNVAMAASSYYEVPYNYTGRIDGILASSTGNARVGELV